MLTSIEETSNNTIRQFILSFRTVTDLVQFKEECDPLTPYTERDSLTLVGLFSGEQLVLAANKYDAICKVDKE